VIDMVSPNDPEVAVTSIIWNACVTHLTCEPDRRELKGWYARWAYNIVHTTPATSRFTSTTGSIYPRHPAAERRP